jgi:AAA15 family ATPase/GTPase
MNLTEIKIEAFKRIEEIILNVADVNILVGANGSGKSSIIQAIHLACCVIRQADKVTNSTSTVGIDELDYLPTNNYKKLGHQSICGNMQGTPSSKVSFKFCDGDITHTAFAELRSARNSGISITGSIPTSLSDLLRKKKKFFSAYIPGVSGIPNTEEKKSKKVILKSCSYGDSNIVLRNALLLLKEMDNNNIARLQNWIADIIGPIEINIHHDEEKDLVVQCEITLANDVIPIELIGTGYLQLIQIFSYVLLFKPGILLIDEPDIHLHPTIQEKLVKVLHRVAQEQNIKIMLTTHSPFIVRGALSSVNVCWIDKGKLQSTNKQQVELALGWGAFGKKVIIITEDSKTELLRKLIAQWPEIEKFVTFYPGSGYKNLPTPVQAKEIYQALGEKFKILIHRDRDSLTDEEVQVIQQKFEEEDIDIWFPKESDIEAYFCSTDYLSSFLDESKETVERYIQEVFRKHNATIKDSFNKQRKTHNEELYARGGSPSNDDVWNNFQQKILKGAKGKFILKQLGDETHNKISITKILSNNLQIEIAGELKSKLLALCES